MCTNLTILILIAIYILVPNFVLLSNYSNYKISELNECHSSVNGSNPCIHGICLTNESKPLGYQCYCLNGFTGINCTKNYDECLHQNPCQNSAICVNDIPEVKCICAKGYCGKFCESEVNECQSNPCLNGARCVDLLNAYKCECLNGYIGERCEIDINVCNNQTLIRENSTALCLNGGTCVEGPGDKFFCICPIGYTGDRCKNKIKECESQPCLNGGRCEERGAVADFYCTCGFGWTGKRCDVPLQECSKNYCKNNAICMSVNDSRVLNETNALFQNSIVCYCLPDFHGQLCEQHYNECDPNPCLNDGICTDGIDSYVCACSLGFIGDLCEINCSDPTKRHFCISPTTVFIDYKTSTYLPTHSIDISPDISSFHYRTSIVQIHSSINTISLPQLNSSTFDIYLTPTMSIHTISDIFLLSSLPSISISTMFSITPSPTILPEIKPSPTLDQNNTKPTSAPTSSSVKIFIPRFNGLNSSLIYDLKRNKRDYFNIKLSFKSDKNDGIILYSRGKGNLELMLYIEDYILKFYLFKSKKQILFSESGFKINEHSFSQIDLKLGFTAHGSLYSNISVKYNNKTQIMSTAQVLVSNSTHPCFDIFYLGELPIDNNIAKPINESHFTGCITDVYIDEQEKLISNAVKVSDISECNPRNICSQNPCRNGATCVSHGDGDGSWRCICKGTRMWRGLLCEEPTCSDQVCQHNGVCILQSGSNTHLCLCLYGWHGKYCELRMNQTIPLFNAKAKSSFIRYNLENLTSHLEIRFRFATLNYNQSKALLLYMGHNRKYSNSMSDFMSISLEFGYLYFRIDLGHGPESLSTAIDVNITEQTVMFGHHKQFVWLIVVPPDNKKIEPIIGKTPLLFKALNVSPYLYVGGHETFKGHSFLNSSKGFQGCIYDIEIRTRQDLDFQQLSDTSIDKAVNIEECNIIDNCSMK